VIIEIERTFDHTYRRVTGLPQVRRSLITPNLYLGGQYNLEAFERLRHRGVTGIVNMRIHSIHKDISNLKDIRILNLPTPDLNAPTQADLKRGASFIKDEIQKGGKVYIHCRHGEGRGPTMAIAYLISSGLTYKDAFALVKKVRVFIRTTKVQMDALLEFESTTKKEVPPISKL